MHQLVFASFFLVCVVAQWSYLGPTPLPLPWTQTNQFPACSLSAQSPINMPPLYELPTGLLTFNLAHPDPGAIPELDFENNGHTVELHLTSLGWTWTALPSISEPHELVQCHFHSAAEHTIVGQQDPLELHCVMLAGTSFAVVGVLFVPGPENAFLSQLQPFLPFVQTAFDETLVDVVPDIAEFFEGPFYAYDGSFTTPPCTEGVNWFLNTRTFTASQAQIDSIKSILLATEDFADPAAIVHGNYRPVQPLNGRVIRYSASVQGSDSSLPFTTWVRFTFQAATCPCQAAGVCPAEVLDFSPEVSLLNCDCACSGGVAVITVRAYGSTQQAAVDIALSIAAAAELGQLAPAIPAGTNGVIVDPDSSGSGSRKGLLGLLGLLGLIPLCLICCCIFLLICVCLRRKKKKPAMMIPASAVPVMCPVVSCPPTFPNTFCGVPPPMPTFGAPCMPTVGACLPTAGACGPTFTM